MNARIFLTMSIAAATVACAPTSTPVKEAAVVPAVTGSPYTVAAGEERKSKRLRNGVEETQVATLTDASTLKVVRASGCSWTNSTADRYGPSLTWNNCSPNAWGTGHVEDLRKEGQLWPFKVGNKASYRYTAVNSAGKRNERAFRNCEVTDTVIVSAGGKDYPSYKVVCEEHNGTRTYHYAPSVETTVKYERVRKRGPRDTMEFIAFM